MLEHYQLSTPYPTEWPAEKDMSDASDDDLAQPSSKGHGVRRSKTRYSALERSASDRRSGVPGAQKSGNGTQNLVSKDEPDPLGSTDSVVMILRSQGLPVQSDINLRKEPKSELPIHADRSRQPVSTVIEYLLTSPFPLASAWLGYHTGFIERPGHLVEVY